MAKVAHVLVVIGLLSGCSEDGNAPGSAAQGGAGGAAVLRGAGTNAAGSGGLRAAGGRSGPAAGSGTAPATGGRGPVQSPGGATVPEQEDAGAPNTAADAGVPDLSGWKLVWNDEFDGPEGARLDASRWTYETGGSGWGNNQLEFDTDRADNAALDGHGELTITARKESYMGKSYTAVRLNTQGKFEHQYGRYEARMRLPFGQGIWPAFWMLGTDIGSAAWPTCGEIDIMENVGKEPDTVHGTLHGPGYSGSNGLGAPYKLASGQRFADGYHVFAIEWEKDAIRWYVDDKLYETRKPSDVPNGSKWVYDHKFFVLLNLAVGGQWPGNPDSSSTFPQTMKVDYVRVYDRSK